jgi:hypothetical protein
MRANPFNELDVISTYTDAEAIEDGTVVAISKRDRVTRTVWECLVERAPAGSKPPNRWPVDMMGWFRAESISKAEAQRLLAQHGAEDGQAKLDRIIADRKALALSRGIVSTHAAAANRVYEENTDGGIYKLYATVGESGKFESLETVTLTNGQATSCNLLPPFWLLPNENGGITLMFPEDY